MSFAYGMNSYDILDVILTVLSIIFSDHLALRLRMPSDVERFTRLPDLIPMPRDRSISLPDVESLRRREQEQHVGRELRRISDAFNTEYRSRVSEISFFLPIIIINNSFF